MFVGNDMVSERDDVYLYMKKKKKKKKRRQRNVREMLGITVNQGQRRQGLYALNWKIGNDRRVVMNPPRVGSLSIVDGQRTQAKCGDRMKLEA